MVDLMDYPAPVGLLSAAGEMKMPFSDTVKYCILGISVTLLLLALGILAWQAFRCCTHTNSMYTRQDKVNCELLYSDEKSATAGKCSGAPSTKVEDVSSEAHRLSRCLSQASFPSSASSQEDGDMGERDSMRHKKTGEAKVELNGKNTKHEIWCVKANVYQRENLIPKVNGSLRFSVYFDKLESRLVVTVLQVEGLVERNQTCGLQPFVKLRLMYAGPQGVEVEGCKDEEGEGTPPVLWTVLQEWRTRIVKGSCNPVFGDQFSCILPQDEDELQHINLRMEVRDFDKFSRHAVLGEVRVPLKQLNISFPVELQEDLHISQKDLVGEVLLSLKFLPTSQRLEVGLLKVRTVLAEIRSDAVLYARISVQCNQCKLRYQKTSVAAQCLVTVFNEVLMFSLPEFPLEQCKIMVSVYETHTTGKSTKRLMGQLTLGKERSSEDDHWNLMMRSVRQPVAKWHGLLI